MKQHDDAPGDDGTGKSCSDLSLPDASRSAGRPRSRERIAVDAVAFGSEELWPVVRGDASACCQQQGHKERDAGFHQA